MTDIMKNLADKTLMDYSNKLTRILLETGIDINKVCLFVKDYQRKYIHMKNEGASEELLKAYTPDT